MLDEVLKPGRLKVVAVLLCAGAAVVTIGCVAQLALSDLDHVPHTGVTPVLKMGEHVKKRGVSCTDCHEGAKKKERAGLPTRETCMDCHEDEEAQKEKLALGGPIFDAEGKPKWEVAAVRTDGVIFSHAAHTAEQTCAECHGDIENDAYGMVDLAARYENCRRCHGAEARAMDCARCHSDYDKDSLPHSHGRGWAERHGLQVRDVGGMAMADRTCGACHTTSTCLQCHQEEQPRDHTAFFTRAGHGLAADIDRERCVACHSEDRCVRCHLDGASPRPPVHPTTGCTQAGCHTALPAGHPGLMVTDNCMFCHK